MTTNDRATRLLQEWLESEAPLAAPPDLNDRINTATRSSRPRPAWIARLEGHHMDVIEGGRARSAPRLGLVLAVLGLLVVALAAAAIFSGAFRTAVVPPVTSPSASAVTASPVALASATASQSPRPTAGPRIPEPGTAIPDELIGVWYVSPGEYLHIQRGPDPYCQAKYRALQDCWIWWADSLGGIQQFGDILTIVDGKLRDMSIGRQDCAGNVSTMTWTRSGNSLQLHVQPGSCFTRDFPTMYLVGSGEGGAPPSVPPLTFP
jgi:hypothetical protein